MHGLTIRNLARMKAAREKIAVLTAYDASFARLAEAAGVDVLLVGDSLGMVVQGHESTLPVTVGEMVYHTAAVARVRQRALLVADMPFMSYGSAAEALANAGRLMKEGGAHMVKLEGGAPQLDTVRHLTRHAVPVCAHLGLLPQSVYQLGGYRVQGRDAEGARQIREDALALQAAGAQLLVLECVPAGLAAEVTASLEIPVIGIGAGADTDGQVLVVYDVLGLSGGKPPSFVRNFLTGEASVAGALAAYVRAVKDRSFPAPEHGYA
jgi:3-methyl-2-oxobutanoate hydroxymethyltransferase